MFFITYPLLKFQVEKSVYFGNYTGAILRNAQSEKSSLQIHMVYLDIERTANYPVTCLTSRCLRKKRREKTSFSFLRYFLSQT